MLTAFAFNRDAHGLGGTTGSLANPRPNVHDFCASPLCYVFVSVLYVRDIFGVLLFKTDGSKKSQNGGGGGLNMEYTREQYLDFNVILYLKTHSDHF